MMPIRFIRSELVQKPEILNIETIGARLKYHGFDITIDNNFSSDCGDIWRCELSKMEEVKIKFEAVETSLRSVLINVLKQVEE